MKIIKTKLSVAISKRKHVLKFSLMGYFEKNRSSARARARARATARARARARARATAEAIAGARAIAIAGASDIAESRVGAKAKI